MNVAVDPDRIALVLADALVLGDKAAAKKWCISKRTVQRYRAVAAKDPKVAAIVAAMRQDVQHDLATLRIAFMRDALVVMREKFEDASLDEMASAFKVVGELHQVATAVEDDRPDSPDPEASEAEGGRGSASMSAH